MTVSVTHWIHTRVVSVQTLVKSSLMLDNHRSVASYWGIHWVDCSAPRLYQLVGVSPSVCKHGNEPVSCYYWTFCHSLVSILIKGHTSCYTTVSSDFILNMYIDSSPYVVCKCKLWTFISFLEFLLSLAIMVTVTACFICSYSRFSLRFDAFAS